VRGARCTRVRGIERVVARPQPTSGKARNLPPIGTCPIGKKHAQPTSVSFSPSIPRASHPAIQPCCPPPRCPPSCSKNLCLAGDWIARERSREIERDRERGLCHDHDDISVHTPIPMKCRKCYRYRPSCLFCPDLSVSRPTRLTLRVSRSSVSISRLAC